MNGWIIWSVKANIKANIVNVQDGAVLWKLKLPSVPGTGF